MKFAAIALALVFSAPAASADPPRASHHHWRNANHHSHYVLYDIASRQWLETIDCRVVYRFNLVRNEMNTLELHDPTRNMSILLNYEGMFLKPAGATGFSFYQAGAFDTRTQFSHYDANGAWTGTITKQHGCSFVEYLASATTPTFRFGYKQATADFVEIYDGSRDIFVKMETGGRMLLRESNQAYWHFKNGRW